MLVNDPAMPSHKVLRVPGDTCGTLELLGIESAVDLIVASNPNTVVLLLRTARWRGYLESNVLLCKVLCVDMCADMDVGMFVNICVGMCVDMCVNNGVDMCVDMRAHPGTGQGLHARTHEYFYIHANLCDHLCADHVWTRAHVSSLVLCALHIAVTHTARRSSKDAAAHIFTRTVPLQTAPFYITQKYQSGLEWKCSCRYLYTYQYTYLCGYPEVACATCYINMSLHMSRHTTRHMSIQMSTHLNTHI